MPYRRYLRAVNDKFGFLATWLPNQKIALGDIGTLEKGVFRRYGSLTELGYKLKEDSSDLPVDFDHSSANQITFAVGGQVAGSASGVADEGATRASIEFSEYGGFIFRAVGCVEHSITSRAALEQSIFDARENNVWRNDWVVIDRLYVADGLTLVVCNSSAGSLTLSVSASAGAGPFDIARTDIGVSVSASSGNITKVVAARGLTPMFSATRLRTGFFFGDRVDTASLPRLKDIKILGERDSHDIVTVSIQDALDEA